MGGNSSKPSTTSGEFAVSTETFDIRNTTDGFQIPCKLWKPSTSPRAAVFFIHGGIFSSGDRETHAELIQDFVKELNLVIVTASFRDGKTTTYETGLTMSDLMAVANFMVDNHNQKFVFPRRQLPFGLVGCSSGGYFAMALANQFGNLSKRPNMIKFCIPVCPVANPHARAMYLRHCSEKTTPLGSGKDLYHNIRHTPEKAQNLLNLQLQFFETYKQMAVAAQAVEQNAHDVPTLVILAAEDKTVPLQVAEHVSSRWCWRLIVVGKGAGHEIQDVPATDPKLSYIPDMNTFLASLLEEEVAASPRPWCS